MMCSIEGVSRERSSSFFACQLFSNARSEQIEAALKRMEVARPKRLLELHVARHASSRPLLSQENRLIGLTNVAAIVPRRVQPRDHGREELVQAVRRDVTHRATNRDRRTWCDIERVQS